MNANAKFLWAALLGAALSACGPDGDGVEPPAAAPTGVLEMPLVARTAGAEYRLFRATLHVAGDTDQVGVLAPADTGLFSHDLPLDTRSVTLTGPWAVQVRQGEGWAPVDARLASPATVDGLTLHAGEVTTVGFRFQTPDGPVTFGEPADAAR